MRPSQQIAFLTLLLAALAAGPALADDTARARANYVKGEAHFSLGEFRAALDEYRRAYLLRPLPPLLFNMAQCHRHLGELGRAAFLLRRFLESKPAALPRAQAEAVLALVEASLKRSSPATSPASPPRPPPASIASRSPSSLAGSVAPRKLAEPARAAHEPLRSRATPIYRRWWFWAAIGGVAAGVVAGAAVAASRGSDPPSGSLATVDWR